MTTRRFQPIQGKAEEIIQSIIQTDEIVALPSFAYMIHLVVEEIVVNIVDYAYPEGNGYLVVCINSDGKELTIEFRDHGIPFNPLEQSKPDLDIPLEERSIGGLGIFLTKEMMDNVEYRYEQGENILIIKKNLV